jgi:hypothetical protein
MPGDGKDGGGKVIVLSRRDERPKCGARTRSGGKCTQAAGWGTGHPGYGSCKLHGGGTPTHVKAAEKAEAARRVAHIIEAERDALRLENADPAENPLEILAKVLSVAVQWQDTLRRMVDELNEQYRYEGKLHGEQTRAEVLLLERSMDRVARFATEMAKANIDERLTKIKEAQAALIIRSLDLALRKAGLEADARTTITEDFARRLELAAA